LAIVQAISADSNQNAYLADNGSPQSALEKARDALARVVKGGGCRTVVEPAACDETVELAKKAIEVLERCAPAIDPANPAPKKELPLEAEKKG
jgi:hypothetical protein